MRNDCAHVVRNSLVQMKAVLETAKIYCKIGKYSSIQSWAIPQLERLVSQMDSVFSSCPGNCCANVSENNEIMK